MKCDLNLYENYPVTKVVHDQADGGYMMTLDNPPAKCPDGKFLTHRAEIHVGGPAQFGYRSIDKTVVIQVPTKDFIIEQHPVPTSASVGWWLAVIVGLGLAGYALYWLGVWLMGEGDKKRKRDEDRVYNEDLDAARVRYQSRSTPAQAQAAVAMVSSSDPFMSSLAGSYMGASLANSSRREEEYRPSRREPDPEPARTYSSDSDSGSSFSSDSGSSFGSDSGGGFSSDSGGGFSSDSGGGFSSD